VLAKLGAVVRDADDIAHELMRRGQPLYEPVVERFGPGIVGKNGEIDRRVLGARVFADPAERKILESLVHPAVIRELRAWADGVVRSGGTGVGIVPLLFEVGLTDPWDATICVTSPEVAVLDRLRGRGLDEKDARERIASQMPVAEKAARATYVVRNDGTRDALEQQVRTLWTTLLKEASHHARSENE
jgi:dephospho-CoA kinase